MTNCFEPTDTWVCEPHQINEKGKKCLLKIRGGRIADYKTLDEAKKAAVEAPTKEAQTPPES